MKFEAENLYTNKNGRRPNDRGRGQREKGTAEEKKEESRAGREQEEEGAGNGTACVMRDVEQDERCSVR